MAAIPAGQPAPDATFVNADREEFKIAGYKGQKPVILAFFPRAFTGG
jgi:peroxiredoxin